MLIIRLLTLCVLLAASPAWAVVTQNTLTSGISTSVTTVYTTASVTPGANRLVLITLVSHDATGSSSPVVSSVTGNGITFTDYFGGSLFSGAFMMRTFRGMSASPTTGAITITFTANQDEVIWQIMEFDGVPPGANGANAIGLLGLDSATPGTSVSAVLSGSLGSGSATYGQCYIQTNAAGITPGAGYALVVETTGANFDVGAEWKQSGSSPVGCSYPSTQTMGIFGTEILSASPASPSKSRGRIQ